MNNRIIFLLGLSAMTILFAFYFSSIRNSPEFKSYDGLIFYDIDKGDYYLEDIESGTDILLEFKYEESKNLELNGLMHVEVHGLFSKNKNRLRVLSLFETAESYSNLP